VPSAPTANALIAARTAAVNNDSIQTGGAWKKHVPPDDSIMIFSL